MNGGGEADVGFVIASGDATELLETAEEVLDQVAPAIDRKRCQRQALRGGSLRARLNGPARVDA